MRAGTRNLLARRDELGPLHGQIVRDIRAELGRASDLSIWQLNQGGVVTRGPVKFRAGLSVNGACDLIGMLTMLVVRPADLACEWTRHSFARWFCLEAKTVNDGPTKEQRMFIELTRRRGGFACIVKPERSPDGTWNTTAQALRALERARRGESE